MSKLLELAKEQSLLTYWVILVIISVVLYFLDQGMAVGSRRVFLIFLSMFILNSALLITFYKTKDIARIMMASLVILEFSIGWYYLTLFIALQRG